MRGCSGCPHTPPLYTNNKLTPADGFTVPQQHLAKLRTSFLHPSGQTRTWRSKPDAERATTKFPHSEVSGTAACSVIVDGARAWKTGSIQDAWPTITCRRDFDPYGVKTFAVKGHSFGLALSDMERRDLIVFLKTL